jgi:hypothetical protein
MAILGESFKDYVKKQIDVRQDKLSLRDKDDDTLRYILSKTSFLRLTSGIDISSDVAQNLGVVGLSGNQLAQKYVLFASKFDNNFTSGVGYSLGAFNASYGFNSDPNFGLVPPPGLTMATINTLNRGTIREATINLVCHNLYQFKIINALFLKLKYSLLLEWGHTLYFNNGTESNPNPSIVTPAEALNLSDEFLKGTSSNEILNQIELKRKESCGNYDAFFGVIKNFNWELQENGSYNIMINAISQGDVIDSLKVNTNLVPDKTIAPIDGVDENIYKRSTLHYILGWIIRKLKDSKQLDGFKASPESNALNTDTLSFITSLKPGYKEPDDTGDTNAVSNSLTYREGIEITFPELGTTLDESGNKVTTPQYYIKLGTLLRIVEAFLLYYDTSKNENNSSPSIFYIDHGFFDGENECITTPRHISADPLTCLIPIDFANASEASSNISVVSFYNSIIKTYTWVTDASGKIISETVEEGESQTNLSENPNPAIPLDRQASETVIGTSDSFGNQLTLVTPNIDSIQDALLKVEQNAASLTGQTITVTVQTITATTQATVTDPTQAGTLSNIDNSFRTSDKNIGNTMHIYVNINKIIEVLDSNIDGNGNVTIYSFLTQLLGEISRAMGSINKFDLDYDETTNRFSVIDTAVFPLKYKNTNNVSKFNINLLKESNNGGGSFVTNFGLKSDVFGQISNAIAIGAQGNGNVIGSNSTPISKFNTGLTDRIITNKQNPNVEIPPSGSWVDQNFETFQNFEEFKVKITNGSVTTYDIDLYKNFLVDLFNYDLGYYTENAVIPGTGFIPLNLQLTMDGLSGIRQYQTFDIDETLLPNEYYDRLKFITTTVTHKVDTKGWETTISSLGVPKTNNVPQPVDQNLPKVEIKNEIKKTTIDVTENTGNTPPGNTEGLSAIRKKIVATAEYWNSKIISEIGGDNAGFTNSDFQSQIKSAGWYVGAAWCNFFTTLCYKTAYLDLAKTDSVIAGINKKYFSDWKGATITRGKCSTTFDNFKKLSLAERITSTTQLYPGDMVTFNNNKDGDFNHIGIVVWFDANKRKIGVIEGNTSDKLKLNTHNLDKKTSWGSIPSGVIRPIENLEATFTPPNYAFDSSNTKDSAPTSGDTI